MVGADTLQCLVSELYTLQCLVSELPIQQVVRHGRFIAPLEIREINVSVYVVSYYCEKVVN